MGSVNLFHFGDDMGINCVALTACRIEGCDENVGLFLLSLSLAGKDEYALLWCSFKW